jgi:hypothetical protein
LACKAIPIAGSKISSQLNIDIALDWKDQFRYFKVNLKEERENNIHIMILGQIWITLVEIIELEIRGTYKDPSSWPKIDENTKF